MDLTNCATCNRLIVNMLFCVECGQYFCCHECGGVEINNCGQNVCKKCRDTEGPDRCPYNHDCSECETYVNWDKCPNN